MTFGRVLTAMVTPFDASGGVDLPAAKRLATYLIENGSDGLVVAGTTGESPTLSSSEKLALFQAVCEAVGDRVPVIAGTGGNDTKTSIELTRQAEALGVGGIMVVTPYYNKPPQEGLYQHFQAIAQATSLPVMLYNVPGRTACNLAPETVARLSRLENVVAVKEASGSPEQVARIRSLAPDLVVYSGDDNLTLPLLSLGATGVVSVAAHCVGSEMQEMIRYFQDGRPEEAWEVHRRLLPIFSALFCTTSPIPVKYAVSLMGLSVGGYRLPLVDPTPQEKEIVQKALRDLGKI